MDKKIKISSTAYRVLLLLLRLNERECNVDDLNSIFCNDPNISRSFSREVILKYISTLRLAGYDISKPTALNNYCYKLIKAPVTIDLKIKELKTLALLYRYAKSLCQQKFITNYTSFCQKLQRYMSDESKAGFNKELERCENLKDEIFTCFENYRKQILKIEKSINDKQRVNLYYKLGNEESENCICLELHGLKYESSGVSLSGYNFITGQNVCINLDHIIDVRQLPAVARSQQILYPVIFKLKGRLAKTYRNYEGEKVIKIDEKIKETTVTAYTNDVDSLLKRLIRYGEYCEVLFPKSTRNSMINLIKNTIKNYQE
jgi:predicted DNA-binding transcriptional regulator YafY